MTAPSAPGRNDSCHCGSGRKYKLCCLEKDAAAARKARAKAAEAAPAEPAPAEPGAAPPGARPPRQAHQPWRGGAQNTRGFQKFSTPRKVGG